MGGNTSSGLGSADHHGIWDMKSMGGWEPTIGQPNETRILIGSCCFQHQKHITDCQSSFGRLFNFMRHLNNYHSSDALLLSLPSESARTIADSDTEEMVDETPLPLIHRPTGRQCTSDLQHEASTLVASLRANSSIPYCVIPEIIQSVDSMIDMTLNSLQAETVKLLSAQIEKSWLSISNHHYKVQQR